MHDVNATLAPLYPQHIETMIRRHDAALAEAGFDHLIIFAGAQRMIFLDDMAYPFKVNPHFKSWVPVVDNPHCFLVYTPGERPRLVFHQPVDYWHKPAETPSGYWTGQFEIVMIATPEEAKQHFRAGGRTAFIGEAEETYGGELNPHELLTRLHWERAWKTDYEIACMQLANERGARGHLAAARAFREGLSEYEIHLDYLRAADHVDEELPYGNIIALNEHASVLHYYHHDRQRLAANERHSFLIDAGASVNGYASDITRTYAADERGEFAELIAAMEEMQQSLCAAVKPGLNYPELHLEAHRKVAAIVKRFGFVDMEVDEMVEQRVSGVFLPHGVGHFIGLQVHDVGGFLANPRGHEIPKPEGHPWLRLTRVVEPRQSFTIEPGLYFIEPLLADFAKSDHAKRADWTKIDRFRKYGGIRIEDDVVVTDSGVRNLTRDAFAAVSQA